MAKKMGLGLMTTAIAMAAPLAAAHDRRVFATAEANADNAERETGFVHHVYFWLKNPASIADRDKLIAGLEALSAAPSIRRFQIGLPANTPRDVVDNSYSVSWLLMFDDAAAQDAYQIDPLHVAFVEAHAALWERVVVFDSVDVGTPR